MTLRTHTITKKNPQHNQEWSWEETPEFVDALLKLDVSTELANSIKVPTLHVPNTSIPRKYAKGN
tara:strand:+ start:861 stop:1055 length:195 start_codon:yes stop_codon:yes gene_type:complete